LLSGQTAAYLTFKFVNSSFTDSLTCLSFILGPTLERHLGILISRLGCHHVGRFVKYRFALTATYFIYFILANLSSAMVVAQITAPSR
jgi:hypothetical protein